MTFFILFIVFLSGLTGLIYQVTWQKYLSIYLGSHSLSASLTLSCFFLFLALGYQIIGKSGHKLGKNKIRTYAYLEGFIGVFAIMSPAIFDFFYQIWPSYPSISIGHFLSSAFFALILIGLPTFLMGGTIPLLTQGLSKELEASHRVHAWVYGVNTLGAFIGTMLGGFFLLEFLGLSQSLNLTGMLNCIICLVLIVFCKYSKRDFQGFAPGEGKKNKGYNYILLSLAFLSGAISFGLENLIIRMAGISIGSSNYTYTVIVGAFVCSIALGSILAAKVKNKVGLWWLLVSQLFILTSVSFFTFIIPSWPRIFMRVRFLFANSEINFVPYWVSVFFVFFIIVLIPVVFLGMTLPLLFQQLKSKNEHLNRTAGIMYAINSIGAAVGSIFLGYIAFFWMDAQEVLKLIGSLTVLSCILVINLFERKNKKFVFVLPILLFVILFFLPKWKDYSFVPNRFFSSSVTPKTRQDYQMIVDKFEIESPRDTKILYSDFGVNTYTVVTEDLKGDRTVFVNGKPDAATNGDQFTRALTALIPLTLAKNNQDIFIVGLGSGLSAGIAASFPGNKSVKVTEIASGVIKALPYFDKWNFDLKSNRKKITILNDDAYKVLINEDKKYDLIFSEPSNTWVTGVEKIYTLEFLKQASSKLKEDGIYSQWFPLFSMTEQGFLSVLYNFKKSFKYVSLWSALGSASVIIASNSPIDVTPENLMMKSQGAEEIYKTVGIKDGLSLLYHQLLPDAAVTDLANGSHLIHSLYHPTLAYQSGRAFFLSGFINPEELANKYFVYSKNEKLLRAEDQISQDRVLSFGDDELIWEKYLDQLPKSFFDEGAKFLLKVHPIYAGKLSLARPDKFGKKVLHGVDEKLSVAKRKMTQYRYLLGKSNRTLPPKVNEELFLGTELFNRFIYLIAMREKPQLDKLLKAMPIKCIDFESECLKIKLEILFFLNPHLKNEVRSLSLAIHQNKRGSKEEVDSLFKRHVIDKEGEIR